MTETMKAAFAEFIALLLFVFLGAGSVIAIVGLSDGGLTAAGLLGIATAHGLAIFLLASAIGHISGGHINPAVTVAMLFTGKIGFVKAIIYIIAQCAGAAAGAFLLKFAVTDAAALGMGAHAIADGKTVVMGGFPVGAVIIEVVATFALVFVIFATAVDARGPGLIAPLAIGMTVFADHLIAVPLTGASMNPARTFGPALAQMDFTNHWVYWAAPVAGAVLAGWVYMVCFKKWWED